MKPIILVKTIIILIAISVISACGSGQLLGPTFTPTAPFTPTITNTSTPTITSTSTSTITPTITRTNTPTKIASPTPNCMETSGKWDSNEKSSTFGIEGPILTFSITNCQITSWEIWVYPAPEELFWWTGKTSIQVINNKFEDNVESDYGEFTFKGSFVSATSSQGSLYFPKGFNVVDFVLTQSISIVWTASPSK